METRRRPNDEPCYLVDIEAGAKTSVKSWRGRVVSSAKTHWWKALISIFIMLLLRRVAQNVISLFHWAEAHVDGNSPTHMLLFLAISLPFHTGLPIPIVLQAWAVAIGCFFRWKGFLILWASFGIGVPMSFLIGRKLAKLGGSAMEVRVGQLAPRGVAYMDSLRVAVAQRPVRLSFLLMWAPLPTSFCPFLVGFMIPPKELPLGTFLLGALPSKVLHFSCHISVGIEAGSFAEAIASEGSLIDGKDTWATWIAVGSLMLSVVLMGSMMRYVHQALHDIKDKEDASMVTCERYGMMR